MTLLLQQLDIQGFKSFATATTFVFDRGITAIIGPNGSGKSNVAEALRWVLGEQGHANLRSRKTEDVIFAGSDKRAPLGMAEVVLTLDNADGDLPLPYAEISIARRAFRSGENQYLINGSRVRLKDVQQLVAPLGQAYTIIGQGLVDAALSARPEERRGLFEHAAGIGGLRLRATDAERSLTETHGNAERLRDILGELEPRVRQLERQARQAREQHAVRERLLTLQRRSYARQWRDSTARVSAARVALRSADAALAASETLHTRAARALGELRGEERRLAEQAGALTATSAERERELAAARHALELLDTRAQAASERLTDLRAVRADLERRRAEALAEAETQTAERSTAQARLATLQRDLTAAEALSQAVRARRADLEHELAETDRATLDLSRALAEADGAAASQAERLRALATEAEQHAQLVAREHAQQSATETLLAELSHRRALLTTAVEHADSTRAGAEAALAAKRTALAERQAELTRRERDLATLRARHEQLERIWASGEGLYAGVRAVLRATRGGQLALPGLLGTLAELIEVPAAYETAIEVALGGHLQDLVVQRWADAEAAIAYLKRANAGRATFQPLDTVRSSPPAVFDTRLDTTGVHGPAATLLHYPAHVAPVVAGILGRTLVVDDLDASRRLLRTAAGWTIVTLAGEITRPSGSVTGGARTADAGLLARERERRALPAHIAAGEQALAEARTAAESASAVLATEAERVTDAQAQLAALALQARELEADERRAARDLETVSNTLRQHAERESARERRRAELLAARDEARARLASLSANRAAASARREQLAAALAANANGADDTLATLRAQLAVARERAGTLEAAVTRAREQAGAAERQAAARAAEIERLLASSASGEERAGLLAEATRLEAAISAARGALPSAEAARAGVATRLAEAERALDDATQALRAAERERDHASLGLARGQDEQVFLAERVRNDLELDNPDTLLADAAEESGMDDEAEIGRLRERLRRMSVVGEDVLEQHEQEAERLAFLTRQLDDVEQATAGLRRILAELNAKMSERFNETFREVAAAFELTFGRLFGGGTARLVMSNNDDGSAAIEIIAQPPGKRLANLGALSGGERALTAVALLIAIQRVNPSPFCLLDEVNAALDEANVVRFRDELRDLASATQFVVITHNRGTIEGADTLYGVSMGQDSVSRVLSLRLDAAIRVVEEREAETASAS